MKIILAVSLLFFFASPAIAELKYNPYSQRWEQVAPDAQLQYDQYNQTWDYRQPGARREYNPYQQRYQWVPPAQPQPQNPYQDPAKRYRWEMEQMRRRHE